MRGHGQYPGPEDALCKPSPRTRVCVQLRPADGVGLCSDAKLPSVPKSRVVFMFVAWTTSVGLLQVDNGGCQCSLSQYSRNPLLRPSVLLTRGAGGCGVYNAGERV